MKKLLFILFSLLLIFNSRANDNTISEERAKEIFLSEEAKNYYRYKSELLSDISVSIENNGSTSNEIGTILNNCIEKNEYSEFFLKVYASEEIGEKKYQKLKELEITFYNSAPELKSNDINKGNLSSDIVTIFNNYDVNVKILKKYVGYYDGDEPIAPCGSWGNFARLGICSTICGALGGPGGFFCVWGCICSFCKSDSPTLCGPEIINIDNKNSLKN